MVKAVEIKKNEVDAQIVETLEGLLEKAKNGELKSILFVDSYVDGKIGMGWAGRPDLVMIGKIEELKFDFFSQMYFPIEN